MYNTNIISLAQINNHFLPKIAREYNIITEESHSSKAQTKDSEFTLCQPLISAGWFSTLFSNNKIELHSSEESKKKEKEESSPNYLQLTVVASITAIVAAFGLGRLRSSTATAEENIWYSRNVVDNPSNWNRTLSSNTVSNILSVANTYCRAETDRKNKLSNYQNSSIGIAAGIGIGIVGSYASVKLLAIIGIITAVVSTAFGVYQVAIHWDDFSKAQDEFKNLNLIHLLPRSQIPIRAPAPGWHVPPYTNSRY